MVRALSFLLESKIFISICAVSCIISTCLILGINHYSLPLLCFLFFSTLLIYNIPYYYHVVKSTGTNTFVLKSLVILNLLFCFYSSLHLLPGSIFFTFHLGVISFLYYLPFSSMEKHSARKVKFLKIFLISYVWACCTVILPVLQADQKITSEVILLFVDRFIFIFAITLPFDIRDLKKDQLCNIVTIPVALGISNSKMISYVLLLVFCLNSLFYAHPITVFISRIISTIILYLLIFNITDSKSQYWFTGFIDGSMILQMAGLLFLELLYV